MTDGSSQPETATGRHEALVNLESMASNRFGSTGAHLLARHVLALHPEASWPVLAAAMTALGRRWDSGQRDGLGISARPSSGSPLGCYSTRRSKRLSRPYRTWLSSVEPPSGSCDCPDFTRGSLGLCKHLLIVLDDLAAKPRRWSRAVKDASSRSLRAPRLSWHPVRPLRGPGDWLERVRLVIPNGVQAASRSAGLDALCKLLRQRPASDDWVPRRAQLAEPRRRLELVEAMLAFGAAGRRRRPPAIDPALQSLLQDERCLLRQRVNDRALPRLLSRSLRRQGLRLYPYQREGVSRFLKTGRLLLADDMGLGKTVQAIAAAHLLFAEGRVRRGLLIVPSALKPQWEREWNRFGDAPIAVVDGPPEQRAAAYRDMRHGFLIANYEQTFRDLSRMQEWDADLVVLDEAQRIKNWATRTAQAVKALRPAYRLVLTGTPMENRLEELASIMDWVDDHALEPKWRLVPFHAEHADGGRSMIGARHLDTLRERLRPSLLRRTRGQVLEQLPERTDTQVPVPMTAAQVEEHEALVPPIARLVSASRKRPLSQAQFLRLMGLLTTQRIIANGLAQAHFTTVYPGLAGRRAAQAVLDGLDMPKLSVLCDLITGLVVEQPGRKVVVFSQWRRMLQLAAWALEDRLAEAGLQSRFFTGAEGQRRRTQNIVDFHDDPSVAVLLLTEAGGVGLNLQRAASAVVNLDMPWNPAVLEQRIGRVHRLGQSAPIDVYHLVSTDSIEERIVGLLGDKRALFEGLFDGADDCIRFDRDGGFMEGVRRIVEARPDAVVPEPAGVDDGMHDPELAAAQEATAETLVAQADEASDRDVDGVPGGGPGGPVDGPILEPPSAADFGSGSGDLVSRQQVESLLGSLEVSGTKAGGLRIEAPPEAARSLAALLGGLARLLEDGPR